MSQRLYSVLSVAFFLFSSFSFGGVTINRLNGGNTILYVDFSIPGNSIPLELVRSYNSLTALSEASGWLGAFGWGWTSPFETTLTTTPERGVILRDGGSGNIVIFKAQKEDPKAKEAFIDEVKAAYFKIKMGRALSASELSRQSLPAKMVSQLKSDPRFRVEMAQKYQIKSAVPQGEKLTSTENGYQTMQFKGGVWVREKDGVSQVFNSRGQMIRQVDKNGFQLNFKYSMAGQVSEISDKNRLMVMKFTFAKDRVVEVVDNRGQKTKYSYDENQNLLSASDSKGKTYNYQYGNKKFPHLITRVDYPSESTATQKVYREMAYDDNGLMTYHREKDGTETTLVYGRSQRDPENQFWTKVTVKSGSVSDEETDEFFIKLRADGSKYLGKQETKKNGLVTLTVFNECCAKPQQVIKNGQVTNFKYYENGLLKEKVGPKEDIRLEYDQRFNKVSKVTNNGVVSQYFYDERGNLIQGTKSTGQKVALKYDRNGRIAQMKDGDGREISFTYNDAGRPTLIAEKGIGSIRIAYDAVGRIAKTEAVFPMEKGRKPSAGRSQQMVQRILSGFQNLLEVIRPAGASYT